MQHGKCRSYCRPRIVKNERKLVFCIVPAGLTECLSESTQLPRAARGVHRSSRRYTKCLHPHTVLMTQIRNVSQKWHPGSTLFLFIFHTKNDRNCEVCKRTKITRALCKKRTREAVHWAEKFGVLITVDHRVLNEGGDETSTDTQSWYKILPLNGSNLIREKMENFSGDCKGNVSCTSYSRTFYDTQMATANCVHPHAQLEHA